jgi:hypothetical protein
MDCFGALGIRHPIVQTVSYVLVCKLVIKTNNFFSGQPAVSMRESVNVGRNHNGPWLHTEINDMRDVGSCSYFEITPRQFSILLRHVSNVAFLNLKFAKN